MDDVARTMTRGEDADLASIVLGRAQAGDQRRVDAPERVPAWIDHAPTRGYDARSVAVLALVVGVLAAIVGWATSIGDEPGVPSAATSGSAAVVGSGGVALDEAVGAAGTAVGRSVTSAAKPAAAAATGANLVLGRLVASRSGSGSGLVTVAITNSGDEPVGGAGAQLLVLADGDVVGTEQVGALAPGASAKVEVGIGWCPAGTVALVAVVDAGSAVRESNERDNSTSRSTSFGC